MYQIIFYMNVRSRSVLTLVRPERDGDFVEPADKPGNTRTAAEKSSAHRDLSLSAQAPAQTSYIRLACADQLHQTNQCRQACADKLHQTSLRRRATGDCRLTVVHVRSVGERLCLPPEVDGFLLLLLEDQTAQVGLDLKMQQKPRRTGGQRSRSPPRPSELGGGHKPSAAPAPAASPPPLSGLQTRPPPAASSSSSRSLWGEGRWCQSGFGSARGGPRVSVCCYPWRPARGGRASTRSRSWRACWGRGAEQRGTWRP